jgi:hypothetical protein
MIIAGIFSFNNGEKLIYEQYPNLWQEVQECVQECVQNVFQILIFQF